METPASAKFENKNKMADSHFAILNQIDVEHLIENSKNQNTLKAAHNWLKVGRIGWQNGKLTRKLKSMSTKSSIKCCKNRVFTDLFSNSPKHYLGFHLWRQGEHVFFFFQECTFLWYSLFFWFCKWGYFISVMEWLVFVCTHTLGASWKSTASSPPRWVQAVMANGKLQFFWVMKHNFIPFSFHLA